MSAFPRTTVGGVSVSRMVIGTNWFLGFSHTSLAKDEFIRDNVSDRKKIADILEVYFKAGVDTIIGMITCSPIADAIQEAQDRTGIEGIVITTPQFMVTHETPVVGFCGEDVDEILDENARLGGRFCLPHQCVTDAMVDRCTGEVRKMDGLCAKIRERGMIPGLSTHMPEAIVYADDSGLDVETYIAIYNSMGFLMQVEVDWVAQIIRNAKKPVLTIKPMAAGQLRPFQALNFVWNTIRDQDMVAVGAMTPREAEELIELSRGILERRTPEVELQRTRSKQSLTV
ncbi:MAG: hypothetical protein K1Y02_18135 [Candidatus Hydrogenedentes bacterium]|nr:hypothetical protein [Candidatus Hydrogenedentota bacterium]